jgi:peptide deformylase
LIAVEVSKNPRYPYKPDIPLTVLVNPVVTPLSEETFENFEGCLSVPNLRGRVRRFAHARVTGLDRNGGAFDQTFQGFAAGTFQHELDHLDATIFVDRITDSRSLTTWTEFERHHLAAWLKEAARVVEKYGA